MGEPEIVPAAPSATITTDDVDQAQQIGSDYLYPQRLDVLDRKSPLAMTMHVGRIGAILIGDAQYGTDIRISCGDLLSYHVNLPLTGLLESRHARSSVIGTTETAAVYGPIGDTVLERWAGDCRLLCIKLEREVVERVLAEGVGHEIQSPIRFGATIDLSSEEGRSWADMAVMLNNQLRRPQSLVHAPIVAAPFARGLITGLLSVTSHQFRAELDRPAGPPRPSVIRKAVEYLTENAAEPITTNDVAAHCCTSTRSLQEGFARHVGQSPMNYLREIRLRRAHDDLVAENPHDGTVASIAHKWGFTHLGRFAAAHEKAFGSPPSETLRRAIG